MTELWRLPWDSYATVPAQFAKVHNAVRVDVLPPVEQVRLSDIRVARICELFINSMWKLCTSYPDDELFSSSAWLMELEYSYVCREFDITADVRAEVGDASSPGEAIAAAISAARGADDLRWIDSLDELRADVVGLNKPKVSGWIDLLLGAQMGEKQLWRFEDEGHAIVPPDKVGMTPGIVRVDNLSVVEQFEYSRQRVEYLLRLIVQADWFLAEDKVPSAREQLNIYRKHYRRHLMAELQSTLPLWKSSGDVDLEKLTDLFIDECRKQRLVDESLDVSIFLQRVSLSVVANGSVSLKRRSASKKVKVPDDSYRDVIRDNLFNLGTFANTQQQPSGFLVEASKADGYRGGLPVDKECGAIAGGEPTFDNVCNSAWAQISWELLGVCLQLECWIYLAVSGAFHELLLYLGVSRQHSSLRSTKTPKPSCDRNIQECQSTPTSETSTPPQANSISSLPDSHVTTPVTSVSEPESMESTPSSGERCSDVSASLNRGLLLWSSLKDLSIADFERCLEDSEWLDIQNGISNSYQQRNLERRTNGSESLSCPTPTASAGENSRAAGLTKCEQWWLNSGMIPNGLQLSAIAMLLLQGFPADYLNAICPPSHDIQGDLLPESSLEEPSPHLNPPSLLPESNILTPSLTTEIELIDRTLIARDGGTQSRVAINPDVVNDYYELYHAGEEFPPIVVFYDGERYWLADGFHRLEAQVKLERRLVKAIVRQGVRRDAVLYSVGANSLHGLRRTNADKRRAVEMVLQDEEWRGWSDPKIASACGVTQPFVWRVRKELFPFVDSTRRLYTDRNGNTASMDISNMGRSKSTPKPLMGDIPTSEGSLVPVSVPVPFSKGDLIEFVNPGVASGWSPGDRARVLAVDVENETVVVEFDDSEIGEKLSVHGYSTVRLVSRDYFPDIVEEVLSKKMPGADILHFPSESVEPVGLPVYELSQQLQTLSAGDLQQMARFVTNDFLQKMWEVISNEIESRHLLSADEREAS